MLSRFYVLLINPLAAFLLFWRWFKGRDTASSLRERLCLDIGTPQTNIWVHAASIGEVSGTRSLIAELTKLGPVLLTVHTKAAFDLASKWEIEGLRLRLSPLDALGATGRFLRQVQPRVLLSVEQEFWLTRFRQCHRRGIPILGVSTRMGEASSVARECIALMDRYWPMDVLNADRVTKMTGSDAKAGPLYNPKLALPVPVETPQPDPALAKWLQSNKPIILAASLHHEDEAPLVKVIQEVSQRHPDIRFVIAPRHPRRAAHLIPLFEGHNLRYAQRSQKQSAQDEDQIYLADTLGEMPLWYSVAPLTMICGSFANRGGHTPVEPVIYGSFPVFGPDMNNHMPARALFLKCGGGKEIAQYDELLDLLDIPGWDIVTRERAASASHALEAFRTEVHEVEQEILEQTKDHVDSRAAKSALH